jgi:hypothetical protein
MLSLKDLITQLSLQEFEDFKHTFKKSKAGKSLQLLDALRDNEQSEKRTLEHLKINKTSYYTLRSRLYDKLQDFLLERVKGNEHHLIEKVSNIPHIIFNYPKKQAIAIIQKFEQSLIEIDQPIHLIKVYEALKRLHQNTDSYYIYSEKYNELITGIMNYAKCTELLKELLQSIGKHFLSRDPIHFQRIQFTLDKMIDFEQTVIESDRATLHLLIGQSFYQIYVDDKDHIESIEPVEDIVKKAQKIIDKYPESVFYKNIQLVFSHIQFEYYHKYRIRKKEVEFYRILQKDLIRFLNSYSYYTIPNLFLLHKIPISKKLAKISFFETEYHALNTKFELDKEDAQNFILFHLYQASISHLLGNYEMSNDHLNEIRNSFSLKNYTHVELEVKLLLVVNTFLLKEAELAESYIKSLSRKIKIIDYYHYPNVKILLKAFQVIRKNKNPNLKKEIGKLMDEFVLLNEGTFAVLPALELDTAIIGKLL